MTTATPHTLTMNGVTIDAPHRPDYDATPNWGIPSWCQCAADLRAAAYVYRRQRWTEMTEKAENCEALADALDNATNERM